MHEGGSAEVAKLREENTKLAHENDALRGEVHLLRFLVKRDFLL